MTFKDKKNDWSYLVYWNVKKVNKWTWRGIFSLPNKQNSTKNILKIKKKPDF